MNPAPWSDLAIIRGGRISLPAGVATQPLHKLPWDILLLPYYYRQTQTHVGPIALSGPVNRSLKERRNYFGAKKEVQSESSSYCFEL